MGSYPWGPHGPQSGPNQVTPNPTPAYVPPPPAPTYYPPSPAPNYYGGPVNTGPAQSTGCVPTGPRKKHYLLAVILALMFGPLGLFYASRKGALVLLFLLFAVPTTLAAMGSYPFVSPSHPMRVIQYDLVMNRMYSTCVFFCVIWSVIGVYRRNAWVKAQGAK